MTNPEIARRRLKNQQLAAPTLRAPVELARWFGAVQAQDYGGACWALAQRAGVDVAAVAQAVNDGRIVRTHVLRPTWHLVAAEDIGWLLALTGQRVMQGNAGRYRDLELDAAVFERSQDVFRRVLAGGKHCTRQQLEHALNQHGIPTRLESRFGHMLMQAELDGVLCSGAWQGKQATYALLEERVPPQPVLDREAAVAELVRRFFTSHGPATLKDFAWWSGLTIGDARAGVARNSSLLQREEIDGLEYWSADVAAAPALPVPLVHLLPNYDEYVVAYTDRSAIFDTRYADQLHMRGGVLNNVIVLNGMVAGGWSRVLKKDRVEVSARLLWPFSTREQQALEQVVRRYGDALGLSAVLLVG